MIYLCTDLDGGPPGVSHVLVVKPPGGGGGHTPGVGWMCTGCGWQFSYDVPEARAREVWLKDERHQSMSDAVRSPGATDPFRCEAVLHSGPGHQSRSRCERDDPHALDDEHHVVLDVATWQGPDGWKDYYG